MAAFAQKRILIVEDDELVSAYLHAYLDEEGWDVTCAGDGGAALQILVEQEPFDLILLDVWLPHMNGLEVLRTLRGLGVPSPVVVMTAYDASFDPEHALHLGASEVLSKPFEVDDLNACLQRSLVV